jgi:hypothetical protein
VKEEVKAVDPKGVLNKTDPDACCEVRKVRPLGPALEGFEAWITGRKRFHGGGRVNLPVVEFSEGKFKFNPLADWTHEHVDQYFTDREAAAAIRWSQTAIRPSAAGPAPCARLTRMTSGQDAGSASRRRSAASITSNAQGPPPRILNFRQDSACRS